MSMSAGFTTEEITAYVEEYLDLPHGRKHVWLEGKPFSLWQMRRWRRAYLAGDLERGLVPRVHANHREAARRARAAEEELAAERSRYVAELARRDEQIAILEAGNVALGKAIGLLHRMPRQEPADEPPPGRSGGGSRT